MYLIVLVISGILGVVFGATLVATTDNEAVAAVIYTIVNTLSSLITLPLFAAVLTIIYFDLRVRKEGFDLQLLARGVGSSAPTSPESVRRVERPRRRAAGRRVRAAAGRRAEGSRRRRLRRRPRRRRPGGLQSGDPLGGDPPRREDDGGATS